MSILMSPLPASGIYGYSVVDRFGNVHDMSGVTSPRLFVTAGSKGLGKPPVSMASDKLPFSGGSLVRHIATQPRLMSIPIIIVENDITDLIARMDEVQDWFYAGDEQQRYQTYFRVTRPDDSVRQLQVFYTGGLEGDMASISPTIGAYVVELMAPDPWPTADSVDSISWSAIDPDLPTVAMINTGDLEAYPVWTITGPATSVNINNITTGEGWLYNSGLVGFNLAAGKTMTIDTRYSPPRVGDPVVDSDGVSRFSSIDSLSTLFTFVPGQNDLSITFLGHSADTEISVEWLPRFYQLLR